MKPAVFLALALGAQAVASDETVDGWTQQILDDIEEAFTCAGCGVLLGSLKALSGLGPDALIDVLTGVCNIAQVCLLRTSAISSH